MDISTALKLIDLGFTTEQIKNFETPAAENTTPAAVTTPVAEAASVAPEPEVKTIPTPEPIDYKKLAEEVALYNQRNVVVQPEIKKEEVVAPVAPTDSKTEAANAILGFLG